MMWRIHHIVLDNIWFSGTEIISLEQLVDVYKYDPFVLPKQI